MTDQSNAATMTDHGWLGDDDGHNCMICMERDDTLHLCWPQAHRCDVCETSPCAWPDVLCAGCRTMVERTSDTITDPVELALGAHRRLVMSTSDYQACLCGWSIEGGPGFHRRHQAAAVYEALGLDGPAPWQIGPDSETGPRMRLASQAPSGSSDDPTA